MEHIVHIKLSFDYRGEYYCILCNFNVGMMFVSSLFISSAFERSVKVLSSAWLKRGIQFFRTKTAINLRNSTGRFRPGSFNMSPWFQAKRLNGNIKARQIYTGESTGLCSTWQQVCSCDAFPVAFKRLGKGQTLLVHYWHSNFLMWDSYRNLNVSHLYLDQCT